MPPGEEEPICQELGTLVGSSGQWQRSGQGLGMMHPKTERAIRFKMWYNIGLSGVEGYVVTGTQEP